MDSGNREVEIIRKKQKEMLDIKNIVTDMKNALMVLLIDWMWLRKESLSHRLYRWNPQKPKSKENNH